jgi:hypothetical protein
MSTEVKVTYINESDNHDNPQIVVFTKNMIPTSDPVEDVIAWIILRDIGKGSSSTFVFPIETSVQATWEECNKTRMLESEIGRQYTVEKDDTGIVLVAGGNATDPKVIEVNNNVNVFGGIEAQLFKGGKVVMTKHIAGSGQKASFVLHPKLYWGIASKITEGQPLNSADHKTDDFFEQDLAGVSEVDVVLRGNDKDGYQFFIENQI